MYTCLSAFMVCWHMPFQISTSTFGVPARCGFSLKRIKPYLIIWGAFPEKYPERKDRGREKRVISVLLASGD